MERVEGHLRGRFADGLRGDAADGFAGGRERAEVTQVHEAFELVRRHAGQRGQPGGFRRRRRRLRLRSLLLLLRRLLLRRLRLRRRFLLHDVAAVREHGRVRALNERVEVIFESLRKRPERV